MTPVMPRLARRSSTSRDGIGIATCWWLPTGGRSSSPPTPRAANTPARSWHSPISRTESVFFGGPAGPHNVLLLDFLHVELRRAAVHLVEDVVDVELCRRRKPDGIDAGHDERPEVRAREPAALELLDHAAHLVVDGEQLRGAPLAFDERLRETLV